MLDSRIGKKIEEKKSLATLHIFTNVKFSTLTQEWNFKQQAFDYSMKKDFNRICHTNDISIISPPLNYGLKMVKCIPHWPIKSCFV